MIKEIKGKYWLDVYEYIDELSWLNKRSYETQDIQISLNCIVSYILNLLQLMNPKGTSIEVPKEILGE